MCDGCAGDLARDLTGAFPTLVAHHQDLVYGIALRSTRHTADAEDLAQEAFLRAYRALSGYDSPRTTALHLRGWLARITLNLARNRARDRRPAVVDITLVPEPPDGRAASPELAAERSEDAAMWRRLLDGLPYGYRTAVELRHVEGLSYRELAESLGKPLGTVKSDVHRGVLLLRQAYGMELTANGGAFGMNETTDGRTTRRTDGTRGRGQKSAATLTPEVMVR